MRVAGIMSGTSLDGVDVAVVDIARGRVNTVAHYTTGYSKDLRARILAVSDAACHTRDISRLNFELGGVYARVLADCCRKSDVREESLELIGCHGQTIYHEGQGRRANTMQIGEASVLAERFGIPVVSDFRTRDMAAGGKGAPLVPFADVLLFHSARRNRIALNLGGIANFTVLPRALAGGAAVAFDTGPGNMVMDQLVAHATNGRAAFDRAGGWAAQGTPNRDLLEKLLRAPWFRRKPPKTAGREQYGKAFIADLLATGLPVEDLLATANVFTAASIAQAILDFAPQTEEIIAAGGGVHNPLLMGNLAAQVPGCRITTTAEFGIDPDAKEAVAFALLAYRTVLRKPGNLPSATGARHPVVLGKLTVE